MADQVHFQWEATPRADTYQIQVATDELFTTILHDEQLAATEVTLGAFQKDTAYWWRLKAIGRSGASSFSTPQSFRTIEETPSAATPTYPTAGDSPVDSASGTVTFQWQDDPNAASYDVAFGEEGGPLPETNTTQTQHTVSIEESKLYSWRVRARSECEAGDWSAVQTFEAAPLLQFTGWTLRTAAAQSWQDVVWSESLEIFVAVRPEGVMTSPDGITWTDVANTPLKSVKDVVWAEALGKFVAIGSTGYFRHKSYTSPDGVNWTEHAFPTVNTRWPRGITWSPELGLFATTGYRPLSTSSDSAKEVITSPDGENWTVAFFSEGRIVAVPEDIIWAPSLGRFVVVGQPGNYEGRFLYSDDGVAWNLVPEDLRNETYQHLAWSPALGRFVAMARDPWMAYSSNGTSWIGHQATGYGQSLGPVLWLDDGGFFLAVDAYNSSQGTGTSYDGINWEIDPIHPGAWRGLAYSPGLQRVVAIGEGPDNFAMTADLEA